MPRTKTTSLFKSFNGRREGIRNASKSFMVRPLTKKGVPSKAPLTKSDWQFNAFSDRDAAEARVVKLEEMNPGSKFVVTEV